jgi:hypothetical protein
MNGETIMNLTEARHRLAAMADGAPFSGAALSTVLRALDAAVKRAEAAELAASDWETRADAERELAEESARLADRWNTELAKEADRAENASQLAAERLQLLTEAQQQADGVGRLVAMLEARERTAAESYREVKDAEPGPGFVPLSRRHDYRVELHRALARWTEAQEALSAARKI